MSTLFPYTTLFRSQAALGKGGTAVRAVCDFNALAGAAKIGSVIAHNIAATNHRKTNAAILTCASHPMAGPICNLIKLLAPCAGDGLTHGQRSARGGVNLVAVVGLENLGIKPLLHELRSDFYQF